MYIIGDNGLWVQKNRLGDWRCAHNRRLGDWRFEPNILGEWRHGQ